MVGLSNVARKILLFVQENGDYDAEIVASEVNLPLNDVIRANMELSDNDLSIIDGYPNVVELTDEGRTFEPIFDDEALDERMEGFPPLTQSIINEIRNQRRYPSKQYLREVLGFSDSEIEIAINELTRDAFIQKDKIQ